MPRKWTITEERAKYSELYHLYIDENKTIGEIGRILGIAEQTVFQRMMRLGIPSIPQQKPTYSARRRDDIVIPGRYSSKLAEFFGIMLGDGKLSRYQVVVTLGTKEQAYAEYVAGLMQELFAVRPKICIRKNNFKDVYIGSLDLTEWLRRERLAYNKVFEQVDIPRWIFSRKVHMQNFLRGFFDTDGSVYKLRFGIQIAFTNHSKPLLSSINKILQSLAFRPSAITSSKIYLTRRDDVVRFFVVCRSETSKYEAQNEIRIIYQIIKIWAGRLVGGEGRL